MFPNLETGLSIHSSESSCLFLLLFPMGQDSKKVMHSFEYYLVLCYVFFFILLEYRRVQRHDRFLPQQPQMPLEVRFHLT